MDMWHLLKFILFGGYLRDSMENCNSLCFTQLMRTIAKAGFTMKNLGLAWIVGFCIVAEMQGAAVSYLGTTGIAFSGSRLNHSERVTKLPLITFQNYILTKYVLYCPRPIFSILIMQIYSPNLSC